MTTYHVNVVWGTPVAGYVMQRLEEFDRAPRMQSKPEFFGVYDRAGRFMGEASDRQWAVRFCESLNRGVAEVATKSAVHLPHAGDATPAAPLVPIKSFFDQQEIRDGNPFPFPEMDYEAEVASPGARGAVERSALLAQHAPAHPGGESLPLLRLTARQAG